VPDLALNIRKHLPGIGLIPVPVQLLGRNTKLNNEIAREVFGLDFTPLFLPQPEEGGLIGTHNDPSIRPADEVATTSRLFPQMRPHGFLLQSKSALLALEHCGTNSAMWHYHESSQKTGFNELSNQGCPGAR
jgi:hypothetical protein